MSLMSAKKLLLISRPKAKPFSISGGWENFNDGWTLTNLGFDRVIGNDPNVSLRCTEVNGSGRATYALSREQRGGLSITLEMKVRQSAGNGDFVGFGYVDAAGKDTITDTFSISGTGFWQTRSITYPPSLLKGKGLTLLFTLGDHTAYADDWRIEGVNP